MTSYDKQNIPLVTALELSVAIHDRYGFTSKSTSDRATDSGKESNLDAKGNPIPNSARLYRQLFPSAKVAESEREKFEITPGVNSKPLPTVKWDCKVIFAHRIGHLRRVVLHNYRMIQDMEDR